jgi:hypothetical protein
MITHIVINITNVVIDGCCVNVLCTKHFFSYSQSLKVVFRSFIISTLMFIRDANVVIT